MAEILLRLTSVSPQLHNLNNTSDERYDSEICDLVAYIRQFDRNLDSQDLLDNLNPSQHTLSYLFILIFQIEALQNKTKNIVPDEIKPGNDLWAKSVFFLRSFDPIQVRYAGHEWRQLIELIGQAAETVAKPFLAVQVIKEALLRLDSAGVLTSVHVAFLRLCLLSRSYSHALPILERQIFRFPTSSGQAYRKHIERPLCSENTLGDTFISDVSGFSANLTYRDHAKYFLYGGMIYMALQNWDKALHWLSVVISSPVSDSVTKIMVEAYKKWVLASLLGHGKLLPPPKMISSHILKVYQTITRPYASLADAFERRNFQRLRAEIDIGRPVWRADNNEGLVSQMFRAYNTSLLRRLGRTFSALTTADVARRTFTPIASLANVEEFVASLVMSGSLNATLLHLYGHGSATMLRFSAPTKFVFNKETFMRTRLVKEGRALGLITDYVDQCSCELKLGNENLQLLSRNQRWPDTSGKGGSDLVGEADGGLDIDEDIMGDAT
ncbi:COP9 signalosome complex subunit 3 [Aspergillus sclerotioniger CBS 115572]|uniref:COP9 signalosome complex subunit 3 n=1 Tax=Aspergillus sclerotioniger CBS 115572 TaxID=1450535 RepID=A0A317X735_9EURO|nr:COP9 signalosome complex subunit 3 [Aspergillus sclerotioniger CBS 115572]PWY93367.1 COP9 signalosome complex subunit 3 [Aspergillus sclerotioniger CBS 115572]